MNFFFYGTLMQGLKWNGILRGRATFQQNAVIQGKMYQIPDTMFPVPAVVDSKDPADLVRGELWSITDTSLIPQMDRFEGQAGYRRVVRSALVGEARPLQVFVYMYPEGEITKRFTLVPHGDFRLALQGV